MGEIENGLNERDLCQSLSSHLHTLKALGEKSSVKQGPHLRAKCSALLIMESISMQRFG